MKDLSQFMQSVVTGVVGLAILIGLNVLAAQYDWRFDATSNKRNSLNEKTISYLKKLSQDVRVEAFHRPGEPGKEVTESLLDLFAAESEKLQVEIIDPDKNPIRTNELNVIQTGTVVFSSGDKLEKVLLADEEKFVNAIIRVTNPEKKKIYVVTGHGELNLFAGGEESAAQVKSVLQDQGPVFEELLLAGAQSVPEDADAVFIFGPQKDFLEHELLHLSAYLDAGGRLFMALGVEYETPALDAWLEERLGLVRRNEYLLDPIGRLISGDFFTPIVQDYPRGPITEDFNLMTLFPTSGALLPVTEGDEALQPVGRSTDQSWLETDIEALSRGEAGFDPGSDVRGPLWLAASYEKEAEGLNTGNATDSGKVENPEGIARAVVFADHDFLKDRYVSVSGNLDLAVNAVNWLLERDDVISVPKPDAVGSFLLPGPVQDYVLTLVPLVIVPGSMLVMAVLVSMRRRGKRSATAE